MKEGKTKNFIVNIRGEKEIACKFKTIQYKFICENCIEYSGYKFWTAVIDFGEEYNCNVFVCPRCERLAYFYWSKK